MRLLPFVIVPLASARVVQLQQAPIVTGEVAVSNPELGEEPANDIAPAIGVHFTTSYAVAAARYHNGTTKELVKVKGDAEYIELMTRWMNTRRGWEEDCQRIENTGRFESGRWKCNWRKASRSVRGLLGLPASRDAATLASFLQSLQMSIADALGGTSVTDIAPTVFPLDQAKWQDFADAMELAGLVSTRPHIGDDRVVYQDVNTAYAGLGHGLCHSWQDLSECSKESGDMHYKDVLYLNFDNSSFSATVQNIRQVHDDTGIYGYGFNPNLGWWNLPVHEVPRAKFWANVHEIIVDTVNVLSRPPSRIVLMGEHGGDAEFKAVVDAALWSVLEVDVRMLLEGNANNGDVGSLAARGAAELAWRTRYWNTRNENQRIASGTPIEL
ncbi:hypothetical protein BKA66DRAFT_56992 [Pyrenochaeta sp. MPI-SDFR-AT-0127]|nr:hypothetical protein BKA66DRAFT_56992 [Pyrenochaeta sp. MPI-SDFR-AT-0127]